MAADHADHAEAADYAEAAETLAADYAEAAEASSDERGIWQVDRHPATGTWCTLTVVRGFTLVELLVVMAIVAVLATLGTAGYRLARLRSAETSAIAALGSINQAQFAYFQTCGNQRYAPSLPSLGVPVPGGSSFLSPDLTGSDVIVKSGYQVQMGGEAVTDAGQTCTGATPVVSYQVTADPISPGVTGVRFFGSNSDRVIYEDTATFAGNMPQTGAPSHGSEIR